MSVRVATTVSILLDNSTTTLDGVTLANGDSVLVKNQTGSIQNGIYIVSTSGAWSRSSVMATGSNAANEVIFVISGTLQGGNSYQCTSSPAVVDTNALVFGLYNNNYQLLWGSPANGDPSQTTSTSVSNALNVTGAQCYIAWSGTLYVAVKYGTANYSTSPDGVTWTARTLPASTNCTNIIWGGGLFLISTNGNQGYSSPDGLNWTSRTIPGGSQKYALTYGNGLYVAMNYNTVNGVYTSPDTITWTQRTSTSQPWIAIAWSGTIFAAIAGGFGASNAIITSPDGVTWTAGTVTNSRTWFGMAWNGSVFCSVATGSAVAITSPDGTTWTERTLPSITTWQYIIAVGTYFVAAAGNASTFALSTDNGVTWTSFTAAGSFASATTQNGIIATNGVSFVGGTPTASVLLNTFNFPQIIGAIGGNAIYDTVLNGIRLVPATNSQLGYVNWNVTGFDFTRDFRLNFSIYQGSGADGVFVCVGGSTAITTINTANGGLAFYYNTFSSNNNNNFAINGSAVGNTVGTHAGVTYTNTWMTCSLIVRTCGTKKLALLNTGSCNSIDNGYDVSNWSPTGTWVGVGARTGSTNAGHWTNFVALHYI